MNLMSKFYHEYERKKNTIRHVLKMLKNYSFQLVHILKYFFFGWELAHFKVKVIYLSR